MAARVPRSTLLNLLEHRSRVCSDGSELTESGKMSSISFNSEEKCV